MMKQHTKAPEVLPCLRRENCQGNELIALKQATLTKYAAQKTKHRLSRFLSVVRDAQERGPMRAQTSLLQGPTMVCSHLVHTCQGPDEDEGEGEGDDTPIVMFDRVLHGVKHLIRARESKVQSLSVYRLCVCGLCVTENDLKDHYSLLVLAAQMTLNERVPKIFFDYVKEREKEAFRRMQHGEQGEKGGHGKEQNLILRN